MIVVTGSCGSTSVPRAGHTSGRGWPVTQGRRDTTLAAVPQCAGVTAPRGCDAEVMRLAVQKDVLSNTARGTVCANVDVVCTVN